MTPFKGIALKLCAVLLFIVMSALIKATGRSCAAGGGGVLSFAFRHSGDPDLAGGAAGPVDRAEGAIAEGAFLARGGGDHGDGADVCRAGDAAAAGGDGAGLYRAAVGGGVRGDVSGREGGRVPDRGRGAGAGGRADRFGAEADDAERAYGADGGGGGCGSGAAGGDLCGAGADLHPQAGADRADQCDRFLFLDDLDDPVAADHADRVRHAGDAVCMGSCPGGGRRCCWCWPG